MVEKKLRKEIEGIALELIEIKEELGRRLNAVKKTIKPVALVLVGLIGLKIVFKILRKVLSLVWDYKLFIAVIAILGPILYKNFRFGQQGETCRKP
jgi:hypothetical protein